MSLNHHAAFKLGLIVNPLAGLGGSVALKGSDNVAELAIEKGAVPKAGIRTQHALSVFEDLKDQVLVVTCAGDMGQTWAEALGFHCHIIDSPVDSPSTPDNTRQAAMALKMLNVDLLLFAGGDGTARDICSAVEDAFPVLGIPAGVKIHSGVYGVTPQASGQIVRMLINGELVDLKPQDVRDIDEDAFRQNQVKAKLFGEMSVPQVAEFVQAVKQGGIEQEELVLEDLAAFLVREMEPDTLYLIGSGKTTQAITDSLHQESTLLGVDAMVNEQIIALDVTESDILTLLAKYPKCKMMVSVIGGQGHVFGRGNQQLSAKVIRQVGRDNIIVLGTKTKLKSLNGRPLIVDTGDPELDKALAGHIEIVTGYQDKVLYPIR